MESKNSRLKTLSLQRLYSCTCMSTTERRVICFWLKRTFHSCLFKFCQPDTVPKHLVLTELTVSRKLTAPDKNCKVVQNKKARERQLTQSTWSKVFLGEQKSNQKTINVNYCFMLYNVQQLKNNLKKVLCFQEKAQYVSELLCQTKY